MKRKPENTDVVDNEMTDSSKKARMESLSLKDVPIRYHAAINATLDMFKVTESAYRVYDESSQKVILGLRKEIECHEATIACQDSLAESYASSFNAMKDKFIERCENQKVLDAKHAELVGLLKKTNLALVEQYRADLSDLQDELDEKIANIIEIRMSVNEVRYANEFGESSSRGQMICPITMNPLMPKQAVIMLMAACNCNCLVGVTAEARPLLDKFVADGTTKCFHCNTEVVALKITTTEEAAKAFAWRAVEEHLGCDTIDDTYQLRIAKTEKDQHDKTIRDTLELRNELTNAVATMRSLAGFVGVPDPAPIPVPIMGVAPVE